MANINHFDFKNYRVFETEIAGRKLTVETGKMAQLANGSCLVRYGETAVLVTATASAKPRDGIDFFPLSVDFEERMYAVGRIPGSFMRREGRPSEKAILSSRQIDRPMRPLFPKDLRNDVSIVCTVLENDYDNSPEVKAGSEIKNLVKLADSIEETLLSELSVKCLIGIGSVSSQMKDIAKSFKEATTAIEVGAVFDTEKNIISFENLGIGRLIYQLPITLCEMFLSEVFRKGSIDSLDQETLFTIQKFFENNLNVSETSRKLFVHRNTLVYRLEKIKKLTGLDLREFDHAIVFKVALMVRKYLASREEGTR